MSTMGQVGILNVGAGDTKLSFDKTNPAERERAAKIVRDMIRNGYALLVEVDGAWVRAKDFDEERAEYIILDSPPDNTVTVMKPRRGKRPLKEKRIDAGKVNAVAVSRTAGG